MFPAVFLDRDGVLIENRSDYVRDWSQVSIFQNTFSALSAIHVTGYKTVMVTNQSAVGRRLISLQIADEINKKLVEVIHVNGGHVDAVYMCPHHPDDDCSCRKPKPGLFLQAAEELSLDLSRSWMIGDAWSDLLAGQAAGLSHTVMVKTGRGKEQLLQSQPKQLNGFHLFDNVLDAAQAIVSFKSI
jgi:histidinol-phosphate phosphatase family protein